MEKKFDLSEKVRKELEQSTDVKRPLRVRKRRYKT